MGFFRRIRDGLNEEFIIGHDNVRRYEEDPDSLDEVLAAQHARGIGSARGLREYAQAEAAAREGTLVAYRPSAEAARDRVQVRRPQRQGWLDRIGQAAMVAGVAALAAHVWDRSRDDD